MLKSLARGYPAGIDLPQQALVTELLHKPVVNKLGGKRFRRLTRYSQLFQNDFNPFDRWMRHWLHVLNFRIVGVLQNSAIGNPGILLQNVLGIAGPPSDIGD